MVKLLSDSRLSEQNHLKITERRISMARCYYLDYISRGVFSSSNDTYVCKLCGKQFSPDDLQIKYTCKAEYGEEYKKCSIYKDRKW